MTTFFNFSLKIETSYAKKVPIFLRNFKNTYSVENQETAASENNIKISINFLQFFTSSFSLWFKFDWTVTELFD